MQTPLCPYYNQCGGCTTQHIPYEMQLLNKKKALATAIGYDVKNDDNDHAKKNDDGQKNKNDTLENKDTHKKTLSDIKVFSDKEYGYRNKIEFLFFPGGLGLRRKNDPGMLVDIENCAIAEDAINRLLKEIKTFFKNIDAYDQKRKTGTFISVTIRTSKTECGIYFTLFEESRRLGEAVEMIKKYAEQSRAEHIMIAYAKAGDENKGDFKIDEDDCFSVKRNETLTTTCLGKTFSYPLIGFFQNNHILTEKMHEHVHELLESYIFHDEKENKEEKNGEKEHKEKDDDNTRKEEDQNNKKIKKEEYQNNNKEIKKENNQRKNKEIKEDNQKINTQKHTLLDLYSGVGTFGIINADLFKEVIMVESWQQSVISAERNIQINKIKNAKALCLDAKQLKKLSFSQPLVAILDPPRSGIDLATKEALKTFSPELIMYVSCNAEQLRKDLMHFKDYSVKSAALFDFFPQTGHSETVIELRKRT